MIKKCKTEFQKYPSALGLVVLVACSVAAHLPAVPGVVKGVERMNETFRYLGYAVLKLPTDLSRSHLRAAINAIASVELKDSFPKLYRRIVVYFTGHGRNGCIYTPDGKVQLEEITMPLSPERAPHLEFVTKIFIFDTCNMIKDSLSHSIFRNSIHLFPALPGNLAFAENDDCGLMTRHLSLALRTSQKSFRRYSNGCYSSNEE